MGAKTLKRILASGFVVIGGAALFTWIWPDDGSILFSSLAVAWCWLAVRVLASCGERSSTPSAS